MTGIVVRGFMSRRTLLCALIMLAGVHQGGVSAATIHKWVDEKGITHYSDQAPGPATRVTRIEVDTRGYASSSALPESDRLYSIANQWKRINQERQQRQQRQQLALQQAALEVNSQASTRPPRHAYDERAGRIVVVNSRRAYRRHGYKNGRHYLHAYRPGGQPYRSRGFPTGN
jgi:hypothetical protein